MLDDVDHRPVEPHFHEDNAAGREIDEVITELGMRQPGHEGRIRIPHADVAEHNTGQQRPAHFADLNRAGHGILHRRARDAGEQRPARLRADQGVEGAEEAGEQSDQRPEGDAQRAAHARTPVPRQTAPQLFARMTCSLGPADTTGGSG